MATKTPSEIIDQVNFWFPTNYRSEITATRQRQALFEMMILNGTTAVDSVGLNDPPGITEDAAYVIGPFATGEWTGHNNEIAYVIDGEWQFYPAAGGIGIAEDGLQVWARDEDLEYTWDGNAWLAGGSGGGSVDSVFGRTGTVIAVAGDYNSDLVNNSSSVSGVTVSDALDNLLGSIGSVSDGNYGDVIVSGSGLIWTLATVNANVGTFGSATKTVTVAFNAKGLATAVAEQNIAIPSTQITDFTEATQDVVAGFMVSGTGITITYNDPANTLTVKLADVATATFKGRITAGTGDPEDLTATQATSLLNTFTSTLKGLVPASGGGTSSWLRADGSFTAVTGATVADADYGDITVSGSGATWTIDNNIVSNAKLADVSTATLKGRVTVGTGDPEDLTGTQATTLLDTFTSALKGLTPASGGGTSNFLRADGSWAVPPGTGAPIGAQYLVATADGTLTAERVATDTATISWDFATAAQGKANVVDNSITDAKLRQGVARSVIGVTGNATANVADIQGTADQVLVVNGAGTALTFSTVATGGITANAVTNAKLATMATQTVKGRNTAGTGDPEDLSMSTLSTMLNLTGLYMPLAGGVFTGTVGYPDGALGAPSIYRSAQAANGIWFGASRISLSANASTQHDFTATAYTFSKSTGLVRNVLQSDDNVAEYLFTSGLNSAFGGASLRLRHNKAGGALASGDAAGSVDFEAFDGTTYQTVARMVSRTLENTTSGAYGAGFRLSTVAQGSTTLAQTLDVDLTNGMAYSGNIFLDQNRLFQLRSTSLLGALTGAIGKLAYFNNIGQDGAPVFHDGTRYKQLGDGGYQTVSSNADFTITPQTSPMTTRHTGTLTADRSCTISNTNAYPGYRTRITRTGSGAFNLNVKNNGGTTLKALVQNTWCETVFDGTDHYLAEYGAL